MDKNKEHVSLITEQYYAQNAKKLHQLADRILCRYGGIYQKDYDDFYSIANVVFLEAVQQYDASKGSFEGFLKTCLTRKFQNEISRRNAKKQIPAGFMCSMDQPAGDGEADVIGGCLVSDFNMEEVLSERMEMGQNERVQQFFSGLSGIQRQILEMKMQDIPKYEILERLHLSEKAYNQNFNEIKSFEKTRVLLAQNGQMELQEGNVLKTTGIQTTEISKNTNYSIASYVKKLNNYTIRGDHSLQRNSNQWSSEQKYNLITTVLNQYPIPEVILAEQVRPYGVENWLIDGKQRLTNLSDYRNDVFKVGRNAERPIIQYQAAVRDQEGRIMLDENGFPQYENREFDVRGRYYSDLPEELKERFNDYTISAVQYLSCSDDDIEYHIRRYNAAKPMSAAQKGITHLGEQYARVVKKLSQHTLFKDQSNFRISEFTNGTMDRVITESMMVIFFLNDWKKKQEDICSYLKEHVKIGQFEHFEHLLDRLSENITPDVSELLNAKEAFIWFGLFDRFSKLGLKDEKFIEFMQSFKEKLHNQKVKGASYDELNIKSTKDKSIVIRKLSVLETLMNRFLKINCAQKSQDIHMPEGIFKNYIEEFKTMDFVRTMKIKSEAELVRIAAEALMMVAGLTPGADKKIQDFIREPETTSAEIEDTLFYLSCLNDWTRNISHNAAIFCPAVLPALVKLVWYVSEKEMGDEIVRPWFEEYIQNNQSKENTGKDCKEWYDYMRDSLERYARELH